MSRYEGSDDYVYPGTEVLRNKADIRDQVTLEAFEADITAVRLFELLENPIEGEFDFKHLCAVHRHIFQDIYDWAGKIRTVDITRQSSRFANAARIESYLDSTLRSLREEGLLCGLKPEQFVERMAHYMGEINATHPFRDGNGRTQRSFCAQLAEQAGYFIDFETVDQPKMYEVMISSFNHDYEPLVALLNEVTAVIE